MQAVQKGYSKADIQTERLTEHIEEWIYAALRYDCLDFSIA